MKKLSYNLNLRNIFKIENTNEKQRIVHDLNFDT